MQTLLCFFNSAMISENTSHPGVLDEVSHFCAPFKPFVKWRQQLQREKPQENLRAPGQSGWMEILIIKWICACPSHHLS